MNILLLLSTGNTKAILPLIPFLLKAVGVKRHVVKKLASESAKEIAKDKIKDELKKKPKNKR